MKRCKTALLMLLLFVIILSCSANAFATNEKNDAANEESVLYSVFSEDIASEIFSAMDNGQKKVTIERDLQTSENGLFNEFSLEITFEDGIRSAGTVNWTLSGRYYLKSTDDTVSNYGNNGSVDYTGTSLQNESWSVYHNVTYKYQSQYEARSSSGTFDITENGKTGIKYNGTYRLKNSSTGNWCDDANVYIIVFRDGSWRSQGNYSNINIH